MLKRLLRMAETSLGPDTFFGKWDVRRKVIDHRAGSVYAFAGQAALSATSFREEGEVSVGPEVFPATRTYRLAFEEASVRVLYPSGNDFITLGFRPSQAVSHLCGSDTYTGRFFFRSDDEWVEIWRVRGPQKRYVSLTRYRRAAEG